MVVIRGDGSADWEASDNRGVDVPEGRGLVVTCHMGSGETHFRPAPEGEDAPAGASLHLPAPACGVHAAGLRGAARCRSAAKALGWDYQGAVRRVSILH